MEFKAKCINKLRAVGSLYEVKLCFLDSIKSGF
jgi:hypothetical protein